MSDDQAQPAPSPVDPLEARAEKAAAYMAREQDRLNAEADRRRRERRELEERKGPKRNRTGALGGLGRGDAPARPARQWSEEQVRAWLATRGHQVPPTPEGVSEEPPADPRAEHMTRIFETSLAASDLSGDVARWRLETLTRDQKPAALRHFIDQLAEPEAWLTLLLLGRVGPGKTSAAIATGYYAAGQGMLTRVVDHGDYLNALLPNGVADKTVGKDAYRDRYIKAGLLILDDLGAELVDLTKSTEGSAHVRKETLKLVGKRVTAGRPTIITTNLKSKALVAMFGDRTWSRLQHLAIKVKFEGPDRRTKLEPWGEDPQNPSGT